MGCISDTFAKKTPPIMSENTKTERKQDASYPSWIDVPLVTEALKNSGEKNVEVTEISVKGATTAGDNYGSSMYRITATLSTGETRSVIIKVSLNIEDFGGVEVTGDPDNFADTTERESVLLADVIPQMEDLLEKAAPGRWSRLAPRCYKRGNKENGYIIMEDLRPLGFCLAEKMRGLGLRHTILVFRTLARFHAASHAVLKKNPNLEKEINNICRYFGTGFDTMGKNGIQMLANVCKNWPGFEDYAPLLEKFKENVMEKYHAFNDPKPSGFNVITHGDCWQNNMMFLYDEDGAPCDVRMVDFQLSHVASPVTDLLYFLCASISEDVSTHHHDVLFREYHFALEEAMTALGLQAPTLEEILADVESYGAYHMITSVIGLPIVKMTNDLDLAASFKGDTSKLQALYDKPLTRKWFQRILPEYRRKGYLPEISTRIEPSRKMSENTQVKATEERPQPSWIDKSLITEALVNSGEKNVEVTQVSVRGATAPGDNYGSSMYRATATLSTGETRSMVVKVPLTVEEFGGIDITRGGKIPNREAVMLADLIPQMEALLKKAAPGRWTHTSPLCYKAEDKLNGYIIMEDLKPLGFRLADKKKGLGLRHCILVMKTYARFHAASHVLLKKNPNLEKEIDNMWRHFGPGFDILIKSGVQSLADVCRTWPGFEDYGPILERYKDNVSEIFFSVNDPIPGGFNVITHGDCWINNMMFLYDEYGLPCDMRLVDFQASHVASPVTDLLYFLSSSVSEDVSIHHHGLLYREYHFALTEALALLGYEAPTFDAIMVDVDSLGAYQMIHSFSGVPLLKSDHVFDLETSIKGDTSKTKYLFERPLVQKWFQRTLPEYRRKGYLPE